MLSAWKTPPLVHTSFSDFPLLSFLPYFLPWVPFMGRILGCQSSGISVELWGCWGESSDTCSPVSISLLNVPEVMALDKASRSLIDTHPACLKALPGDRQPRGLCPQCSSDICWLSATTRPPCKALEDRQGLCDTKDGQGTTTNHFYPPQYNSSYMDLQIQALWVQSVSSVAQLCLTLCDPMD